MASIKFNSKMIHWKVEISGVNITDTLSSVLASVDITHRINKPSTCRLEIRSSNYIEDYFVENTPLKVYVGRDSFSQPLVFSGMIMEYPEGTAKEMLTYTVTAEGDFSLMTTIKRNKTFTRTPIKSQIVYMVAANTGEFKPVVDIADMSPIPAGEVPQQRNQTDLEFLVQCAHRWNCALFLVDPGMLYFVDYDSLHQYGDVLSFSRGRDIKDLNLEYILSYRSDIYPSNVESVKWTHTKAKGGDFGAPGVAGASEGGRMRNPRQYELVYQGRIWRLKGKYLNEAQSNPLRFKEYSEIVLQIGGKRALTQFFRPVTGDSPVHQDNIPPLGDGYGFELEITLNDGDPYVKPPRRALLYAGSLNPRADSSDLPAYFFQGGVPAVLNMNEVQLRLHDGFLKTILRCKLTGTIAPRAYRVPALLPIIRGLYEYS